MANLDKNNAGVHPINSLQVISQVDDGQTNQLMFGRSNRNIGQLTSSPRSMFSLYSSPQLCVPLTTISPRGFNKSRSKSKSKYMPVFPGEDEITQMKLQIARLEK